MNLSTKSMAQANSEEVLHAKAQFLLLQQQLRGLSQLAVENSHLSFGSPFSASQDATAALLLKKEQETNAANILLLHQQRLLDETKLKLLSAGRQHSEATSQMASSRTSGIAAAAALGRSPLARNPLLTAHLSLLFPPVEQSNSSIISMLLAPPEQASFPSISSGATITKAAGSSCKYDDEVSDEEYFKRKSRDANSDEDDCEDDVHPDYESFPIKLYRMIYESEKNGKAELIQFSPCTQGFVIHKPEDFASDIMPQYFKTSRFSSLQRQLNLYGFQKVPDEQGKARFFHKYFIKGKRVLCNKIVRKRKGKKGSRSRSSIDALSI